MPYQRYARILSVFVTLGVVYLLTTARPPGWTVQLTAALATLVFAAFVLDAYFFVRDYRRGELFLIRNVSLYVSAVSIVIFVGLLLLNPQRLPWWMFLPVLLFYTLSNVFHLRLDSISLSIRTAFGQREDFALFSFTEVKLADGDFIEATLDSGEQLTFHRRQFSSGDWKRLVERMQGLGH